MPTASRQPLNYAADDLRGVLDAQAPDLRQEIDHWRAEVHRTRARLEEAKRLAGLNFHAPNVRVDTPEKAGVAYRRARDTLHFLLKLDQLLTAAAEENILGEDAQ